jgi:transposase
MFAMPKRKKEDPKLASLKQTGALNPHPEKVQDTLFSSNEFFDARDLLQVKYEMLRRVKEDGWSISQASSVFGFSRPSFYQAQSDFDHAGLSGFIPQQRGPRAPHKLSGEVMDFIDQVRLQEPRITTLALITRIKAKFGIDVHRRTIERATRQAKKKRQ